MKRTGNPGRCRYCGAAGTWEHVYSPGSGHTRPMLIGLEPDPEGRVVWSNDRWHYIKPSRTMRGPENERYRAHGPKSCGEPLPT